VRIRAQVHRVEVGALRLRATARRGAQRSHDFDQRKPGRENVRTQQRVVVALAHEIIARRQQQDVEGAAAVAGLARDAREQRADHEVRLCAVEQDVAEAREDSFALCGEARERTLQEPAVGQPVAKAVAADRSRFECDLSAAARSGRAEERLAASVARVRLRVLHVVGRA